MTAKTAGKEQAEIEVHYPTLFSILAISSLLWFFPNPQGLEQKAWHLFIIFLSTIFGVIFRPLPVAPVVFIGLAAALITNTLTPQEVFDAYAKDTIWLILFSFFLARAFVKCGLALRISTLFVKLLGSSTLGLSYGIAISETILATMIPSLVARTGGIIYPILVATTNDLEQEHGKENVKNTSAFLMMSAFQVSCVSSAMFMTAMAANPIIVSFAAEFGLTITWSSWALAASLPGVVSIILIPYFLHKTMGVEIKHTPSAKKTAASKLESMGPLSRLEKYMLTAAALVLSLWIVGPHFGISSVTAAMLGLSFLFITQNLGWKDCIKEETAWATLFWLGGLVSLSTAMKTHGIIAWLSENMIALVGGFSLWPAFVLLLLFYFYSHYFFASNTAHVTAMFTSFLGTSFAIGAPKELAFWFFAFFSSLFGGLTHYSSGPAPIFYAAHTMSIKRFWLIGFLTSLVFLFVWMTLLPLWWNFVS